MVQVEENLPDALPATDGPGCARGNSLVLHTDNTSGAAAACNAANAAQKSKTSIGLNLILSPNIPFSILGQMLLRY